jgi:gliding motility-associated-like protein
MYTSTTDCELGNKESVMENGETDLNNKFAVSTSGSGYSEFIQQSIILPKKNNQYYVFYKGMSNQSYDDYYAQVGDWNSDIFLNHIVDMSANSGKGKVVIKDNLLMSNARLSVNSLSAARHANGRDWWLVLPHREQDILYTFRITPDTILSPTIQNMGGSDFTARNWGQSNFSEDGSLYVHAQYNDSIEVNSFDRCSGIMTNIKRIASPIDTVYYYDPIYEKDTFALVSAGTGVCFSPNNQYLYIVSPYTVWQYDLSTGEFVNMRTDKVYNWAEYVTAYNAPDGRIYIGNWNITNYSLSYIEHPNTKGFGANFCQFCLHTPLTASSPPNMPNYDLGALAGSPCDTLRFAPIVAEEPILIPNGFSPNEDGLNDTWHILNVGALQYSGYSIQAVGVYNRLGNEVYKSNDINFEWDAQGLASDTYFYYIRYRTKEGVSKVQKGSVAIVR